MNTESDRGRNEVPVRATKILTEEEVTVATSSKETVYTVGSRLASLDVPIVPNIDAEILKKIEADPKSFWMGDWHFHDDRPDAPCGTAHCRAGWAIVLAGQAGWELEDAFGSAVAGNLIYVASRPGEEVPDFYAETSEAIDDIRACAARQLASSSP